MFYFLFDAYLIFLMLHPGFGEAAALQGFDPRHLLAGQLASERPIIEERCFSVKEERQASSLIPSPVACTPQAIRCRCIGT